MDEAIETKQYHLRPLVLGVLLSLLDWMEENDIPLSDYSKLAKVGLRDERFFEIILGEELTREDYLNIPILPLMRDFMDFFKANFGQINELMDVAKSLTSGMKSVLQATPDTSS